MVTLAIRDLCLKWLKADFIPVNSVPTNATLLKVSEAFRVLGVSQLCARFWVQKCQEKKKI